MTWRYAEWQPPRPGEQLKIGPGIGWVQMPLDFPPSHVNCWLLEGDDHWTIVDCGINNAATRAGWDLIFHKALDGRPVGSILCTHHHVDHIGLASWLCERADATLRMARTEWLYGKAMTEDTRVADPPRDIVACDRRRGFSAQMTRDFWNVKIERNQRNALPLPRSYQSVAAGDVLMTGSRAFEVLTGAGHSPEPLLLFSPERNVIIVGDQVLPRITPYVGTDCFEPDGDPLGEYIKALEKLTHIPDTVLVLPSHGRPFYGLRARLQEIAAHHYNNLRRLLDACAAPSSIADLTAIMLGREPTRSQAPLAAQECSAHLNYLWRRGFMTRSLRPDGMFYFQTGGRAGALGAEWKSFGLGEDRVGAPGADADTAEP